MKKKLSIIIPYHSEKISTIKPLMQSIDNQSGIHFEDIEIIMSKDTNIPNEIDDYPFTEYPNISDKITKIISEVKNNPGASRQAGLDVCNGEYVCFCDADDCLLSQLDLRVMLEQVDSSEKADVYRFKFIEEVGSFVDDSLQYLPHDVNWIWVFAKIYKVEFLKKHNIRFNPSLRWHEDTYFNLLCRYCNPKSIDLNNSTYLWKFSRSSITRVNDHEYTFNSIPDYLYATAAAFEKATLEYKVDCTNDILGVITRYYYTLNDPTSKSKEMYNQVEHCYYNFVRRVASGLFKGIPIEHQVIIAQISRTLDIRYIPERTLPDYLKYLAAKYEATAPAPSPVA